MAEYVELLTAARDALQDLLAETKPGTGMELHAAYVDIERAIGMLTTPDVWAESVATSPDVLARLRAWFPHAEAEAEASRRAERRQRDVDERRAWRQTPRAVRERVVLEALGDDRLSVGELCCRLRDTTTAQFTQEGLREILKRLVAAGELSFANEPPAGGGRRRAVYSRNGALSGAIVDLERAFHASPGVDR